MLCTLLCTFTPEMAANVERRHPKDSSTGPRSSFITSALAIFCRSQSPRVTGSPRCSRGPLVPKSDSLRGSAGKPCGTTKVTPVTVGEEGSAEVEELTEEDRQYLDAERAGIQMEEAPEPAENPTLVVLSEGVV